MTRTKAKGGRGDTDGADELQLGHKIQLQRHARGLTQEQLAQKAGIPYTTLTKIESGAIKNPSFAATSRIARALEVSLDEFLRIESLSGELTPARIYEDVLARLRDGDTMYISGVDERRFLEVSEPELLTYISELKQRGIKQKLLSCEGDDFSLEGKHLEYRWIPKEYFNPNPIYVYADTVSAIVWKPLQAVILRSAVLADAYRKQFLFMWANAKTIPKAGGKRK